MFTGTNLIANPFNTTNHTLGYLLPNCPDGTRILKNSGVASECQGGVWNPADVSLYPGEGAILVILRVLSKSSLRAKFPRAC